MLQAILALVERLLGAVLTLLGIAQAIREDAAREHTPYAIETIAANGTNTVIHPTWGNQAIRAYLSTLRGNESATLAAILAAIVPNVTLPTPAPSGYGGASAAQVWAYFTYSADPWVGYQSRQVRDWLQPAVERILYGAACQGYQHWASPDFAFVSADSTHGLYQWLGRWQYPGTVDPPVAVDWSQWDGVESLAALLNRIETVYAGMWGYVGPSGVTTPGWAWATDDGATPTYIWRCNVPEWMLPLASGRLTAQVRPGAPAWPGLAGVTLGTPVPLDVGVTVDGPMHGVLISITGTPLGMDKYIYHGDLSYRAAGGIVFQSDNGDDEAPQLLGLVHGIYTPRTMQQASAALLYCKAGVSGTVTPWLRDGP